MNWSASMVLRSENPPQAVGFRQNDTLPLKGLRRISFQERIAIATSRSFPRLPGTPARSLGGSSCFWVLVAPIRPESQGLARVRRLSKAIRVNAGEGGGVKPPNLLLPLSRYKVVAFLALSSNRYAMVRIPVTRRDTGA
jgi:hypothetical protein